METKKERLQHYFVIINKYDGTIIDKGNRYAYNLGENNNPEGYLTVNETMHYNGSNIYAIKEITKDQFIEVAPYKHCLIEGEIHMLASWKNSIEKIENEAQDKFMKELIDEKLI